MVLFQSYGAKRGGGTVSTHTHTPSALLYWSPACFTPWLQGFGLLSRVYQSHLSAALIFSENLIQTMKFNNNSITWELLIGEL